jgi:hypothetical protein
MNKITRVLVLTSFCLFLIGGSQAFANNQPNSGKTGKQDENFIVQLLEDIFGDPKQGNNNSGNPSNGGGGGTTAPIDGGISLLLAAGIGMGVKKMARRKPAAARD